MAFYQNLSAISLAGFQVFEKVTHIPIRRITLLFGPNSAGKSSVEDALEILYELYGDRGRSGSHSWADEFDFENSSVISALAVAYGKGSTRIQRLHRHWRRLGEGPESYAERMHLGLEGRIDSCSFSDIWEFYSDSNRANNIPGNSEFILSRLGAPTSDDECCHDVRLVTEFRLNLNEFNNQFVPLCDVQLHINGIPLTAIVEDEKIGLNIQHWALHQINWPYDFTALAGQFPEYVSYQDGWVWLKVPVTGREKIPMQAWRLHDVNPTILKLATEFIDIYNDIFFHVLVSWSPFINKPHKVPASRTIPAERDLVFFEDKWNPSEIYCPDKASSLVSSPFDDFGLKDSGNTQYSWLPDSSMSEVNRMLTDHLFMERGYRLEKDCLVVLSIQEFSELGASGKDSSKNPHDYSEFTRYFLVDSQGREFSFSEVGSGLGYVLPVLCAACGNNPISLIQQPELHLHPALQAALGDVFIEASSVRVFNYRSEFDSTNMRLFHDQEKKFLVETHSEHILLRILKRIRQTNNDTLTDRNLRIKADEVAVVYFDPSPNGITQVNHLRISEDGDFLDPWPRGFFDERGKELFDE